MMISDEKLMAYVDGELDAAGRSQVETAMAADPALADKVRRHRRLRERLSGAHGRVLAEASPPALIAAARGQAAPRASATVVDLAAARAKRTAAVAVRPPSQWSRWAGLAACLVVGVGVSWIAMQRPGGVPIAVTPEGLAAQNGLAHALDAQAGASSIGGTMIGVSYRSADHRYCRTFELDQGRTEPGQVLAGVACREPSGWKVRVVAAANAAAANASGYRTAASALPPAVAATVDATIDGAPLDAQGEAAAKAHGWRPQ
jgi:hypothetical protein